MYLKYDFPTGGLNNSYGKTKISSPAVLYSLKENSENHVTGESWEWVLTIAIGVAIRVQGKLYPLCACPCMHVRVCVCVYTCVCIHTHGDACVCAPSLNLEFLTC